MGKADGVPKEKSTGIVNTVGHKQSPESFSQNQFYQSQTTDPNAKQVIKATESEMASYINDFVVKVNQLHAKAMGVKYIAYKDDGKPDDAKSIAAPTPEEQAKAYYEYEYYKRTYGATTPYQIAVEMAEGYVAEKTRVQTLRDVNRLGTTFKVLGPIAESLVLQEGEKDGKKYFTGKILTA